MCALKHLSEVFQSAEEITFDDSSKIVLISDCHRGDGSWADDFSKNQSIYFAALTHYYYENYTYIELGDGDELWENNKLSDIIEVHSNVFWLLSKFLKKGRLHVIYGNHDMSKKHKRQIRSNSYRYLSKHEQGYVRMFENIKVHEGLILRYKDTRNKIFLIHGHQVDFLNYNLSWLARFLVKYLWKPLELYGINDPTSAAKNYEKKASVEKKLIKWIIKENQMLIAGHTHKPMFAEVGAPPYFNDGSCVHPRCITAIEISGGRIVLVKWSVNTKKDGTLFVGREVLAGPRSLKDYFNTKIVLTQDSRTGDGDVSGLVETGGS